ncbi:MAG: URC4/urg3 family protein [Bosea sp. (in: a-proteobacteria)]|uniref:URC4/urg3 family protein n=1 Tax=Bosea sp. (in: a-proteobacteria) TaxID=1871050 RepID=UPI002732E8E0|nr:URC4/urg3 family protein [Bosea sp. (in: a-proteobacteria)]MDP3604011.1 URC4/urg3 family protein [Bosea sp. (in: a-proteobacteria)]
MPDRDPEALRLLLKPAAIRARAQEMLRLGLAGDLLHFTVHPERLEACADYVLETIRANYPTLEIPFHARWRHFTVAGMDRWALLDRAAHFADAGARGRAAYDLAVVSVLLDAGAGPDWSYRDAVSGKRIGRSEGLALASLDMFAAGLFSADPAQPLRADAAALKRLDPAALTAGFQSAPGNALLAVEGRAALLNRLGEELERRGLSRPGDLFDRFLASAETGSLRASHMLGEVLATFGGIWPSRLTLAGIALGDTWRHPLIAQGTTTAGLVPFHKLSQWLTYSLIEPLQWAGIAVVDIDELTGLPEYRNGGLLLDGGVIALKDAGEAGRAHEAGSTLVVEWRALTVALLDEIGALIRQRLGRSPEELPLAKVLEGGTWAAGRRIAAERRPGGGPPLTIISDGTVF